MALSTRSIITLEQLKLYLGSSADPTKDSLLETWIDWVSGSIEDWCERKIVAQSITDEVLDGNGADWITPRYIPIVSLADPNLLTNIYYRNSDGTGSWVALLTDATHAFVEPVNAWRIELLGSDYFPRGYKNIKLSYIAGYTDPPAEIKKVCAEMVQTLWDESKAGSNRLGLQSMTPDNPMGGGGNKTFLPMRERHIAVLEQFRRLV